MKMSEIRKEKLKKITYWSVGSFILVTIGFISCYFYLARTNPVPYEISKKLTFSPLILPDGTKNYVATDYKFDTVEDGTKILSFLVTLKNNSVSVSEYTQPPAFSEITDYKSQFLNNVINQYATIPTANGTIFLGRMTKQKNGQMAIMVEKGLVIFMRPEKEMSENEWRNLGDSLEAQKITN